MIPTIEQIIEDLLAGSITKERAVAWLREHMRLSTEMERERCAGIISLAREGEIDGDFRSLISRINNPD